MSLDELKQRWNELAVDLYETHRLDNYDRDTLQQDYYLTDDEIDTLAKVAKQLDIDEYRDALQSTFSSEPAAHTDLKELYVAALTRFDQSITGNEQAHVGSWEQYIINNVTDVQPTPLEPRERHTIEQALMKIAARLYATEPIDDLQDTARLSSEQIDELDTIGDDLDYANYRKADDDPGKKSGAHKQLETVFINHLGAIDPNWNADEAKRFIRELNNYLQTTANDYIQGHIEKKRDEQSFTESFKAGAKDTFKGVAGWVWGGRDLESGERLPARPDWSKIFTRYYFTWWAIDEDDYKTLQADHGYPRDRGAHRVYYEYVPDKQRDLAEKLANEEGESGVLGDFLARGVTGKNVPFTEKAPLKSVRKILDDEDKIIVLGVAYKGFFRGVNFDPEKLLWKWTRWQGDDVATTGTVYGKIVREQDVQGEQLTEAEAQRLYDDDDVGIQADLLVKHGPNLGTQYHAETEGSTGQFTVSNIPLRDIPILVELVGENEANKKLRSSHKEGFPRTELRLTRRDNRYGPVIIPLRDAALEAKRDNVDEALDYLKNGDDKTKFEGIIPKHDDLVWKYKRNQERLETFVEHMQTLRDVYRSQLPQDKIDQLNRFIDYYKDVVRAYDTDTLDQLETTSGASVNRAARAITNMIEEIRQ
jgi:hypothetical protein